MWATGQFKDIQVHVEGDVGDRVTLVWEVDEQDLLRNVAVTGLTSLNPREVTDSPLCGMRVLCRSKCGDRFDKPSPRCNKTLTLLIQET